MAGSVSFYLKKPKEKDGTIAKDETLIILAFRLYGKRYNFSTAEKVFPSCWSKEKQRVLSTMTDYDNINTRLLNQKNKVLSLVRDHLIKNDSVIISELINEISIGIKPEVIEEKKGNQSYFEFVKEYIKTTNKAPRTKLSYGTTITVLTGYQKTQKEPLTFDSFNIDFYDEFTTYMKKEGYSVNYTGTMIKNIKVFQNYANDKGFTKNQGHRHRNFKKTEEATETIYLNDKELTTLYELDLSANKKLDRVRDIFLIGCYTGLRYSDLRQLTPANIINNQTQIKVKTQKTGELVIIPLHWRILSILEKYNWQPPRAISNTNYNKYLKELGKEAKFNSKVTVKKRKKQLEYEPEVSKSQLISTHTARRSFATNMFLANIPTISIMKITGHTTERAFMKYIKITQEQNADKLMAHPYFTKPIMKVAK